MAMTDLDARDQLTIAVTKLQRRTGIRIPANAFEGMPLANAIVDVRDYLRAFDGELCRLERLARAEGGDPEQMRLEAEA
jgi:hypothetical protein